MANPSDDPILRRFTGALRDLYGDRVERVVLFGSRARGEATGHSDYDVAVFLTSVPDEWQERWRLADLRLDMLDETGAFFDTIPIAADRWGDRTPLMHDIRRDGVEL